MILDILPFAIVAATFLAIGTLAGRASSAAEIAALRSQIADLETALDLAPALAELDARARRAEGAAPLPARSEPAR